jgi:hypothetical protein
VGAAKNDDSDHVRPPAAGAERDDAVDDAAEVWFPGAIFPQRSGSLLGDFDQHQNCNAVFCHRVGWPEYTGNV